METFPKLRDAARAASEGADAAHDYQHVLRVAAAAHTIAIAEGADVEVAVPAALLHELFNYPKDHPESSRSGELCAERAEALLAGLAWPAARSASVGYCIRVHPFSRGIVPETLEARVLQDADRLDAIGAIGVARCFATGGAIKRPFYDPADPLCRTHEPDDQRYCVDHFYRKLLKIPEALHTASARRIAEDRAAFMRSFLAELEREINSAG
jgi:uncharacterized protein